MKYFVYKYTYQGDVIYIGKTDDVARRVREHASGYGLEEKFLPYLNEAEIYFHECGNEVEMSALERLLINQYKPILNVVDIVDGNATVFIELDWKCYIPANAMTSSAMERDIMLCQKNIFANETRIQTYANESAGLQKQMRELMPFYEYLRIHHRDFALNPDGYFGLMKHEIPPHDRVQVGSRVVEKWYDSLSYSDDITWVQFSGELLQALFMVSHKPNWVDETMAHIGENRCRLISKKVANLRRRNRELEAKKEALKEKRYETIF